MELYPGASGGEDGSGRHVDGSTDELNVVLFLPSMTLELFAHALPACVPEGPTTVGASCGVGHDVVTVGG